MATVRKRKWVHNGKEAEAWVVNYTDQAGKRRQKSFEKKKEADSYRVHVEGEIAQGVHVALNETVTFGAAAEAFIEECYRRHQLGDMTLSGVKGYEYRLQKYATPHFCNRRLSTITASDVQEFIDKQRLTFAAATVLGNYTAIHVLMTFAVRKRWLRRNILRDEPCKLPRKVKRSAIPDKQDIRALLEAASRLEKGENLLTFVNRLVVIACGVFGGFRPGETFGLQWEDIDWQKGIVNVRHSHTKVNGLKAPKTEAGWRRVPLTEPMRRALYQAARYWTIRAWAYGPGHRSESPKAMFSRIARAWDTLVIEVRPEDLKGFVVLTKVGKPMSATASATTFWHRLMKDAGLYDEEAKKCKFTPHALRHAAASLLIEHGLDDMNLKAFMGHASISTTKDIYGHLLPTDNRMVAATEVIAAELDATRERQISIRHPIH
ncbi:tyrosine-type recombinase/integrase [Paenirhodobacter populi]|nr:site-specific integrase [Sinirhodobacter populi]